MQLINAFGEWLIKRVQGLHPIIVASHEGFRQYPYADKGGFKWWPCPHSSRHVQQLSDGSFIDWRLLTHKIHWRTCIGPLVILTFSLLFCTSSSCLRIFPRKHRYLNTKYNLLIFLNDLELPANCSQIVTDNPRVSGVKGKHASNEGQVLWLCRGHQHMLLTSNMGTKTQSRTSPFSHFISFNNFLQSQS